MQGVQVQRRKRPRETWGSRNGLNAYFLRSGKEKKKNEEIEKEEKEKEREREKEREGEREI